jgi:hypothetical protein
MAKKQKELKPNELKFVEHYAEHGKVADAAEHAKIALRTAYKLKKHPKVAELVSKATEMAKLKIATAKEKQLEKLNQIEEDALNCDFPNYAAALKAIELKSKMLGYFEPEKQEDREINVSISVLSKTAPEEAEAVVDDGGGGQ